MRVVLSYRRFFRPFRTMRMCSSSNFAPLRPGCRQAGWRRNRSREPFDLGDGSRIVRVAIVRVLPVFHPETDRHGRRHFVRRVAPDFQQRFVVIVRYGASFAVRLRCDPGDRFVVACGLENSARHHIYRVRSRSDISDAAFELLPNTAVEFVLNLRRGIGCVIGLYDQFVRTVAVGVGYLVPPGVELFRIVISVRCGSSEIDPVAARPDVDLFGFGQSGIALPFVGTSVSHVSFCERIGYPVSRVGRFVVVHRVVALRSGGGINRLRDRRVGCRAGRKLVPGGMIRPCSFGGKGCRRTLRRGAVGRRYDAVNRVRRCGQKIGEVGGRFVSDNSGNDTSCVAAVRCGIEELHLGCVSGVGQTTGNLRCTRSYVAYARCGNSRGRVWSRNSASCSLRLPREITDSSTVFRVLLDLDRCVLPVAYYIREFENFF